VLQRHDVVCAVPGRLAVSIRNVRSTVFNNRAALRNRASSVAVRTTSGLERDAQESQNVSIKRKTSTPNAGNMGLVLW